MKHSLFIFILSSSISVFAAESGLKKLAQNEIPTLVMDDAEAGSWEGGTRANFKIALQREAVRCKTLSGQTMNFAGESVSSKRWCDQPVQWFLKQLETVNSLQELYQRAVHDLSWYQSVGSADAEIGDGSDPETGSGNVLFTGYLTYDLNVRLKPDAKFQYPIYRAPAQPTQFSRAEIVQGQLEGKGLEIAYADNPIDPYLLEVQGSGVLKVVDQNGAVVSTIRVKYANKNGKPYKSLRKIMEEARVPSEFTKNLHTMQYYFKLHPEQWLPLSNQNPSYVFFEKTATLPSGAHATVTPKHSIAVDPTVFPFGAIGIIHTMRAASISNDLEVQMKPFAQFVIAQDKGGAIKSPGHIDVYFGSGDYARTAAGALKHRGNAYFFLSK